MNLLNRIEELGTKANNAKTYDVDGRQVVVNACKELYHLLENEYHNAGAYVLLKEMYADLTGGNFSDPFMCEQKKGKFKFYMTIYIQNILPILQIKK